MTRNATTQLILNGSPNQLLVISASDLMDVLSNIGTSIAKEFLPKKEERYLSPNDAAKKLSVDPSTLYRWNKSGYLKAIKIGNKKRYRLSDIEKLMGEN